MRDSRWTMKDAKKYKDDIWKPQQATPQNRVLRFIEFPDSRVYHYVKEVTPPRTLCSAYAPHPVSTHAAHIVEVRGEDRQCCKECFKRAKHGGIKIPPRTPLELAKWQEECG